jgi:DNA (cytosine-5)-methyltransferase 1
MNVLGIEANIGSMLYPFQEEGHQVIGNYDSRGIINKDNFFMNFPSSVLYATLDEMEEAIKGVDIDVIVSQPSCSKFSQLSRKQDYSGDICVDLGYYIQKIKPKFAFIESKLDYIDEMPQVNGYKYQLEWVPNWYYGNTQKTRDRLWVMLIRDDIDWEFTPHEQKHSNTVEKVIADLPATDIPEIDHVHIFKPLYKNSITKERLTLDETFEMLKKDGKLSYVASDGTIKHRINRKIAKKEYSTAITGGGTWYHWDKKYPLTVREKARIQGFPDEFSFKGLSATKKDKAIGKSMPFEFTRYLVKSLEKPSTYSKIVPDPFKLSLYKKLRLKSSK